MKISDFLEKGRTLIVQYGLECGDPLQHMRLLVSAGLGITMTELYTDSEKILSLEQQNLLNAILLRRTKGEPLQYILGYEWFYNSRFEVGAGVLIPRKETEHLVDELLHLKVESKLKIAELGAGSGNVGISVLLERGDWEWHGFEINPESIPYLGRNVGKLLPLGASYFIHQGSFFDLAPEFAPFDVVISNPPYISFAKRDSLSSEVKFEPALALYGGEKGFEILEHLIHAAYKLLGSEGLFYSEIGSEQTEEAFRFSREIGFRNVEIIKDLAGKSRIVKGEK